jgi:sugar lactone lactonase YvrE
MQLTTNAARSLFSHTKLGLLAASQACTIAMVGCGTATAPSKASPTPVVTAFAPTELAFDAAGDLYASDCYGGYVFKIGRSGQLTIVAGRGGAHDGGLIGEGGPATAAEVECPYGLTFKRTGELVIADHANNRIRQVGLDGTIKTIVGTGPVGSKAGSFGGDGGPATQAHLQAPVSVLFDQDGNLYIGDRDNGAIRKVSPDGTITTIAGTGTRGYGGDGGPAVRAQLDQPEGMVFDASGNLYVVDSANDRIRKIDTHGIITTVAGTGAAGYTGDGGPAIQAKMQPDDLVFDPAGNLYIAEFGNHVVRMIDTNGIIRTIAGTGKAGCSGYGAAATKAQLTSPLSPALDSIGNLYITDQGCNAVLRIDAGGTISIFAKRGQ